LGVYSQVKHKSYRLTAVLGVKRDDLWRELIWSDIEGADLQEVVEQTHTILAREGVPD
jgi:ribosomal protein L12E/L44/L45/RPP1/RPP2